jgi:hypothetical protein
MTASSLPESIQIASAPYVRMRLYAQMSGLTVKAIEKKIEAGKWVEGREYRKCPDGNIWISVQGVVRWIEGGAPRTTPR